MDKQELIELIHSSIDDNIVDILKDTEYNDDEKRLISLTSKISVLSTLKVLEELNILKLPKD